MQPLVKQFFEKAKNDKIKVTTISQQLGIPQDRIYKWKSGDGAPKAEDVIKIQKWLKTEEVPMEELDLGAAIKEMRAVTSALLSVSAEILANVSGRSAAVVRQEVDTLVKNILNASGRE